MHFIQSILYFIQVFYSFSLMLIAMTYNYILFFSLICGHIFGYLIFSPINLHLEMENRIGDFCCN